MADMTYKRNILESMQGYVPRYYDDIKEAQAVLSSYATEINKLNANIDDVLAQFYVESATWGLANWETILGITTDDSKPIDQRRSVVKSKLRGVGTVTVSLIQNVAESYLNGEVDVTEDSANYTIDVKFVGKLGIPPNLDDIKNVLREIIPAHLAIEYSFTYATYENVADKYASYNDLKSASLTYDDVYNGRW